MLRRIRHRLFVILQAGLVASGGIALAVEPQAWRPIAVCVAGSVLVSYICDRLARRYLRKTLGRLRRAAEDLGRGRTNAALQTQPGDGVYKLASAINLLAGGLARARREEQRLHQELRRKELLAFLGELAASVAHEVNNPLDGVQNCSRILRRSLNDRERATQMLDLMDSGLERIELIVRRLLTLAREHVIRPEPAHLALIVNAATAAVAEKVRGRGVEVQTFVLTKDDRALVDPALLEHVVTNLVLNAADSMPAGGTIEISVRRDDAALAPGTESEPGASVLEIEIADRGEGISPEVLPHIFEPFFTTKGGDRGTGLGLAIAARIVDAHHGRIDVAPREGGGTVFTVRVPALPRAGETLRSPAASAATA